MLCEKCKKNVATVTFYVVKNMKKIEHSLCENCSKQENYINNPTFSYSMENIIGQFMANIVKHNFEMDELQCGNCGITYGDFKIHGKLGCYNDYNVFQKHLENVLMKIHNASEHQGKISSYYKKAKDYGERLNSLQKQLKQAIDMENYEQAAEVRDRIKTLEGQQNEVG